jgi:RNA polymerase sigma-70 factor (ECF subfamily)
MSFPVSGHAARTAGEAHTVQTPPSAADIETRRLVTAIGRGDEVAFRELYDRYQARLFRLALVLGQGDEPLAGDIVQSVFITAATKLRHVESEEHLWNWLARVARQHSSKARRNHDNAMVGMADLPERFDVRESDSVLEERLDAALVLLEPDDRRLIECFYFDGLSHKEIAGQLGTTPKAVSSRLERARAQLRSALKQNSFP